MAVANITSLDDLTITDREGHQVTVQDTSDFEDAFKDAVAKKDGEQLRLALLDADYRLETSAATFYYFQTDGYLVYQEGGKQHVYQGQLTALIAGAFASQAQDPSGEFTEGAPSVEVDELAQVLARVDTPLAYLLEYQGKTVFIFAAGKQDTADVTVSMERMTESGRGVIIDFQIDVIDGSQDTDEIYPYAILTFNESVNAIARTTVDGQTKEWPTIPMQEGQRAVLIHPRAGSLLTQRVTLRGKAAVPDGRLEVEIEDGHQILAHHEITVATGTAQWGDFEVTLDLDMPTNLSGSIIFFTKTQDGVRQEELVVPVLFTGGK